MSKSWEQILGGYATDTLTEEEKRHLFEAALHDQALFDTLADEEALKALLAQPEARQRILASLASSRLRQEAADASPPRVSWFRQSSSLAWAGGIAAAGLALIFGWQMNKDWGPLVQQEQEAARAVSEKKEQAATEVVGESPPIPLDHREPAGGVISGDERPMPTPVEPSPSASVPEHEPEADITKARSLDSLGRFQAAEKTEKRLDEEGLNASHDTLLNQPPQVAEALPDHRPPSAEPALQAVASPDSVEMEKPASASLAPARKRVSAEAVKKDPLLPPGALDRFYAGFGAGAAEQQAGKTDGDHSPLENVSSELVMPKSKAEKRVLRQEDNLADEAVISKATGIRYSFLRTVNQKEEEYAEGAPFAGDWRNVRLAIEPNYGGFLYMFAPIGRGNWQQLTGFTMVKKNGTPDSGNVEAYQVVEFNLGGLTNRLGKLVISSVTVLLSPTPLENLGKWLSEQVNMAQFQIEHTDDSVYVVRPGVAPETPFRLDVILEE